MGERAMRATVAYQRQMQDTVDGLRAQLATYRAADQANTPRQT